MIIPSTHQPLGYPPGPRVPRQVLVSLAFLGGSLCAAFVVSLAATWALCEAAQSDDAVTALEQSPRDDAGARWGRYYWLIVVNSGKP